MCYEDVLKVSGAPSGLCVEVRASAHVAASAQDYNHGLDEFIDVGRELVCVPSVLVVASVGID